MHEDLSTVQVAVLSLGYVDLPLCIEFAKKVQTRGFDVDQTRVNTLIKGEDSTKEVSPGDLLAAQNKTTAHSGVTFCGNLEDIKSCNVYIVTVPTPIDDHNQPDFKPLLRASEAIGSVLTRNDIVIYESTVFPGLTEEICVPTLERASGLAFNKDFYAGYSPERINPGDPNRRLPDIKKVVAGSTPEVAEFIDRLYGSIITAGTYRASSIRVAEAAKVIENIQRDVNIALINELAIIFNKANIDTAEVLEAAGTKWNFLPFRPGLVGGHCIGVDPYYLTYKAIDLDYHPEMILAGRRINENMADYIGNEILTLMTKKRIQVVDSKMLVLGITFKENCPDIRNTKVTDIIRKLAGLNVNVEVHDPWADPTDIDSTCFKLVDNPCAGEYDAIILAVAHDEFKAMGAEAIHKLGKPEHILYDVKCLFDKNLVDGRL